MIDESTNPGQPEVPTTTSREKLDKAAKLRAEAAQLIADAARIEAKEAKQRQEANVRDHRILGAAVMELAVKTPALARVLLDGVGLCSISVHDRRHLAREDSALAQLRQIVNGPASKSVAASAPVEKADKPAAPQPPVPSGAWFDVPYIDRERVPYGVIYDAEARSRFAPTRVLVEEMRALGFHERPDLADRQPPARR